MANQQAKRDDNWHPVIQGETDNASRETRSLVVDPITQRLKVDSSITNVGDIATSDNQTNGNQQTKIKETAPTDSTKNNSSLVVSFNASGQIIYLDETIGASTYRTTITRSDMSVDSTLPISAWSEV